MNNSKENWISAEMLHGEMTATAGAVRKLRMEDAEFQSALDLAIAALVRDPSGHISHVARIATIYLNAVGRRAESEFDKREAA